MSRPAVRAVASTIALLSAWLGGPSAEAQTTATWNSTVGNWTDFTRWSTTPFYPDNGNGAPNYAAVIGGGGVNLDANVTLDALTLNGGTLSGPGALDVTQLNLMGGTLGTTGALTADNVNLRSGTLARSLTLPVGGNNLILNSTLAAGVTLTNPAGASLLATLPGPGEGQSNGPGNLLNEGTFIKSGPSLYYLSMPVTNSGLVRVEQNNLRLDGGGTHSGDFEALFGTRLELGGTQVLTGTSTVAGPGSLLLFNATATINGSVTTSELHLFNSTLTGNGALTPGTFKLESGTLARNLTLSPGTHDIGNLTIAAGRTLTNPVGVTLSATTGGQEQSNGPGTFMNQGTFTKSGGATYYLSMPMTNSGMVQVQQGPLRIDGGGTHSGQFEVAFGARLELGSNVTLTPTSSVSGAGDLLLFNANATLNGPVSTGVFHLFNSNLGGTGALTSESFILDSGTLNRSLNLPVGFHEIGNLTVASGRTLTNPVGATLQAITTIQQEQSNGPGLLVNEGTFIKTGGQPYYLSLPISNPGLIHVQQGTLQLNKPGVYSGQFEVDGFSQLEFSGDHTLTAGSSLTGNGQVTKVGTGTLELGGTSSFVSGLNVLQGAVRIVGEQAYAGGTQLSTGTTLELQGDLTGQGDVTISLNATLRGNGSLGGGSVGGNTPTVRNSGLLFPGDSVGAISIVGDFEQTATGKYLVEIAGPGVNDHLAVLGTASLGGTLDLGAIHGYIPASGSVFHVLSYEQREGEFANLAGDYFGSDPGKFYQPVYLENHLALYVPLAGDANFDGEVSGADFTIWADNFGSGTTWAQADFNGDGTVTGADFTIWADHFGDSVSLNPAVVAPEPSTWGLLTTGAVLAGLVARGRRRK